MSRPLTPFVEDGLVWLLAFALTTYLALSGGGYDIAVRSEIGIVIWWILLLGLIVGVLPRIGLSRATWIALIPLTCFFAWTWLGTGWTSDQEATLVEVGRVATYGGAFLLAACLLTRRSARALLYGLAAGIALVSALAVLSKLVPSLFPRDVTAHYYATTRLRYPFDYSDGVGEFAALGIPLLLFAATGARSVWGRAMSAGALPVVLLCLAMTVSRGGILAAAVSLVIFFALVPDRIPRLATALIVGIGTIVLTLALLARKGLTDQLFAAAPAGQRHSMLVIVVVVSVVVSLAQAALTLAVRHGLRPRWSRIGRRGARVIAASVVALGLAAIIVFFASGAAHRLWDQFKQPNPPVSGNTYVRLLSVAGSHRYQYWQVAFHAFESSPAKGIGPGTFQFYWAQHQTLGEYVLNAHSLWIETLAELGIIGLLLLAGFFLWVIGRGAERALRGASAPERLVFATAVAGVVGFCAAAAFDWVWQIGVVPMVAMLLCAVSVSGWRDSPPAGSSLPRLSGRLFLIAGCLVALWTIARPLATTVQVRRSQDAAQRGQFLTSLRDAANAQEIEPGAATPRLQRALILEQLGDVDGAAQAIAGAAQRAPTDWQIWLVASRIATEQDRPQVALTYYRRARSLNPKSPLFDG